jgi:hypothetical protein
MAPGVQIPAGYPAGQPDGVGIDQRCSLSESEAHHRV